MSYRTIYAIDFDGTLARTKFPEIIEPIEETMNFCKELRKDKNNILILWTCRCGEDLTAAVQFCEDCGLRFDYVNENHIDNVIEFGNDSRKIFAHVYIDDKAVDPQILKQTKKKNMFRRLLDWIRKEG